jgi:hypothetical protein
MAQRPFFPAPPTPAIFSRPAAMHLWFDFVMIATSLLPAFTSWFAVKGTLIDALYCHGPLPWGEDVDMAIGVPSVAAFWAGDLTKQKTKRLRQTWVGDDVASQPLCLCCGEARSAPRLGGYASAVGRGSSRGAIARCPLSVGSQHRCLVHLRRSLRASTK